MIGTSDDPRRRMLAVLAGIELACASGDALAAGVFLRIAELVDPDLYQQVAADLLARRIPHPADHDAWITYLAQHRWPTTPPHPS